METRNVFCMVLVIVLNSMKSFGTENSQRVDSLLHQAIFQIYDEQWIDANHTISSIQDENPDSPVPYFYRGTLYFRKLYSTLDNTYKDSAKIYFEKAYSLSEKLLDENDRNTLGLFYHGGASGYLGMYYVYDKSYFSAAKYGLEGVKLLKRLLKIDSTSYDAYLGLGIYTYSAGKAPGFLRWLLDIWGVDADVDAGMAYLRKASNFGKYATYEAKDKLANFYLAEKKFDAASSLTTELKSCFPNSSWFSFLDVLVAYKAKKWREVLDLGEGYKKLNNKSHAYAQKINAYEVEALFNIGNYNNAIDKFKEMKFQESDDYVSRANIEYFVARSLDKLGNDREAKQHFLSYIKIVDERGFTKDEDYEYAEDKIK